MVYNQLGQAADVSVHPSWYAMLKMLPSNWISFYRYIGSDEREYEIEAENSA